MSNTTLFVLNSPVRTDADGRYCLNDLHKAAGGENKHRPSLWAENQQTHQLISAMEAEAGIPALISVKGGNQQGTYVAKELVYAYAMWISPVFHLKVIRAFDAMVTGEHQPNTSKQTISTEAFKLIPSVVRAAKALGLDKNAAAISANQVVAKMTGTNVMQLLGHTHLEAENQLSLFFTPTELGKQIGVSGRAFNMLLAEAGLQAKKGDHWAPLATAEGFCRILDTGKRHGDGSMIQQVKWAENVLSLIQKDAA